MVPLSLLTSFHQDFEREKEVRNLRLLYYSTILVIFVQCSWSEHIAGQQVEDITCCTNGYHAIIIGKVKESGLTNEGAHDCTCDPIMWLQKVIQNGYDNDATA